ncbi:hypothetical protein ZWY2020_025832 [Hordeum vulgare]|nr:hypothetical protein ZWY2020_025832 [Hordeum vulgare]
MSRTGHGICSGGGDYGRCLQEYRRHLISTGVPPSPPRGGGGIATLPTARYQWSKAAPKILSSSRPVRFGVFDAAYSGAEASRLVGRMGRSHDVAAMLALLVSRLDADKADAPPRPHHAGRRRRHFLPLHACNIEFDNDDNRNLEEEAMPAPMKMNASFSLMPVGISEETTKEAEDNVLPREMVNNAINLDN